VGAFKSLPTSQYELAFKCPHAEGLIKSSYTMMLNTPGELDS